MSKIVITGAGGFIGRHLVAKLKSHGHEILCLGRSTGSLKRIKGRAKKHVTDYSADSLAGIMDGYEIMVHLAGRRLTREDDPEFVAPFVCGAMEMLDNLLRAAKESGLRRVITTSSIGVYSLANTNGYDEDELPKPATPYGLMKLLCEQAADFWGLRNGVSVAHVRLAQCYGYGEKDSGALMRFVSHARRRKQLKVSNGGIYQIDQVYVVDAVRAFEILINSDIEGPFNIGSGVGYSVLEIAQTANSVFDNNDRLEVEPATTSTAEEPQRHMNISKAQLELDWKPHYDLHDGFVSMKNEMQNEKPRRR